MFLTSAGHLVLIFRQFALSSRARDGEFEDRREIAPQTKLEGECEPYELLESHESDDRKSLVPHDCICEGEVADCCKWQRSKPSAHNLTDT